MSVLHLFVQPRVIDYVHSRHFLHRRDVANWSAYTESGGGTAKFLNYRKFQ